MEWEKGPLSGQKFAKMVENSLEFNIRLILFIFDFFVLGNENIG